MPLTTFELSCRLPFDWAGLVAFLAPRAIPGVEEVTHGAYIRHVRIAGRTGRLAVRPSHSSDRLTVEIDSAEIFPAKVVPSISAGLERLFDLDADPVAIGARLRADRLLGALVRDRPGLRVPGTWDGFELAVRAILGQQVTVKGATTLAGRLVREYGRRVPGGFVFPEPGTLARARFTRVGIPQARAAAIRGLAGACTRGELRLEPGSDAARAIEILMDLPGVGDWTAQYIAMRALGEPDAFPSSDLGLLKAAGRLVNRTGAALRPAQLRDLAESWRPWRSYAAMQLWHSLA